MKKKIITIGREFGSGGRIVAQTVAEKMGYKFYDKELIARVAEASGFSQDYIEDGDEHAHGGGFLNMSLLGASTFVRGMNSHDSMSNSDKIFVVQCNIIENIADSENAVIVGRSANYVLRKRSDALHVFIHADIQDRIRRAVESYDVAERFAEKTVLDKDRERAAYFKN